MINTFTLIFLLVLAASVIVQFWLASRQLHHVLQHRDKVPSPFDDSISLAEHHKAADYTLAKVRFSRLTTLYSAIILLLWTMGGGLDLLDSAWSGIAVGDILSGTLFIFSVLVISSLLSIPTSLYSTFVLEEKFGFNKTTLATFFGDLAKELLITAVIAIPLLMLVLWLMKISGELWWLYVWMVWFGFSLLMMWAYPKFIAPLFNKFAPLEEGVTRERIQQLLERTGFKSNGIFVMDGSKRSGHSNAYFTGLGNNKRIVFFDTLTKSLDTDELESVLAHELGHFKFKHIHKNILLLAGMSLAGLYLLGWLIQKEWFYTGLGVSEPSTHAALVLFMFIAPLFTFFLQPVMAFLMRKHEFEADEFAVKQTSYKYLLNALVKLYKENASTLTPDPVYSAFYDSHPPAPIRVQHIMSYQGENGNG
jgi:STE24 endopeptidase